MGNLMCMSKKETRISGNNNRSRRYGRSQRKLLEEDEAAAALHRRALSMALHQHQLSQRFDNNGGSMSRRIGSNTTSRRRTLSDPFSNSKEGTELLENLKGKRVVLIHGEGFGAWCWYKNIALLEESGIVVVALDLLGSGIDTTDTSSVTTLADYSKPLVKYMENLPDDEKAILVGHGCGGAVVSYVMEQFPHKISKAIFVCATMVASGQKPFDVFAEELGSSQDLLKESTFLIYGNGNDNSATGFMLEKQQMKALYFNQCPAKDIALAIVSMRPVPLGPVMEELSLSPENYGGVRRYYIQTLDDRALSPDVQEKLVRENPPKGVYKIKGSDHCPFFSKPQSLHKMLVEIAQIP